MTSSMPHHTLQNEHHSVLLTNKSSSTLRFTHDRDCRNAEVGAVTLVRLVAQQPAVAWGRWVADGSCCLAASCTAFQRFVIATCAEVDVTLHSQPADGHGTSAVFSTPLSHGADRGTRCSGPRLRSSPRARLPTGASPTSTESSR
jgi:hypothetical protein